MRELARDIRLLEASDYRVMPWKNGAGLTRELAKFPPSSGLNSPDLQWRISIADVATDGPFSRFPGLDRSIMLIEGAGMTLRFNETTECKIDTPYQPLSFSGDSEAHCTLLDGPVRDFNVMTARRHFTHRCEMIRDRVHETAWVHKTTHIFCVCLRGGLVVKLPGETEWKLKAGQSLWLMADQTANERISVLLAPGSANSVTVLVTLTRQP